MIRSLKLSDLTKLEKEARFPLPRFSSNLHKLHHTIVDNEEIIGSFWIKLTSEVSLILNESSSPLQRARAIKEAEEFLKRECKNLGLDDTHLFIKNSPLFAEFLKKHFQFEEVTDQVLYRSF
jgi:hypothetical protein